MGDVRDVRAARVKVLAASLLAFLLSANIAWLNPAPEFEVYRTGQVPFLWQYNPDAGVELVSAAWFPEAFRTYPQRTGRPAYPALVNGASHVIEIVASPVMRLSRIQATGVAYAGFKLVTVIVAGQLAFAVLRRRLGLEASVLGATLFALHWHMIEYAAAFHTTDLQMTATVAVLWITLRVIEREQARHEARLGTPSTSISTDTFVAALLVGLLLLAKQTLVAPLAVLAVLVLARRWALAIIGVLGAALPSAGYLAFLGSRDIPFRSWEVEEYGQGAWVVEGLREPGLLVREVWDALAAFPVDAFRFYGPLLVLAGVVLALRRGRSLRPGDGRLIVLMSIAAFFQYLAVQRKLPYMTADLAIVVLGAAAVGIVAMRRWARERVGEGWLSALFSERAVLVLSGTASVVTAVVVLGNLPWVAPSDQPSRDESVLENRIDILERPEAYSEDARERARDGRLVEPDVG